MSPVQPSNVARHELIGLRLKVSRSSCRGNVGLEGRVLDETRNTIVVGTAKGRRTVLKKSSMFQFILQDGSSMHVDGRALVGKPEDRLLKE